ncbi:MAG TPA: magnesium transporter [Chlamydiales bacterium]|jgi:magnesium transporter|nr:magnesium transporter [Chlamydiales bacterium]
MLEKDLSKDLLQFAKPVQTLLPMDVTIGEALTALRKKEIQQKIIYFYVVDERQALKGVVSTRQLLLADPAKSVQEVMEQPVIKLHSKQTLKAALELFAKHPLLAIPLVDENGCLLGTIDIQMITNEAIDIADSRTRLDVFQMIGLSLEDGKKPSLRTGYRLRMPWLLCNVFSGIVCAIISRVFEVVLAKYLLLAFFIPLVLTLSESTSMQSMTQSLLFLRRPRFQWRTAIARGFREWQLTVLLAVSSGFIVGALSLLWGDGIKPSLCIGIGICLSVILSAIFGITLPVLLHRIKLDPKVASGPVVLMIADMLTTALYLSLAAWWLL